MCQALVRVPGTEQLENGQYSFVHRTFALVVRMESSLLAGRRLMGFFLNTIRMRYVEEYPDRVCQEGGDCGLRC